MNLRPETNFCTLLIVLCLLVGCSSSRKLQTLPVTTGDAVTFAQGCSPEKVAGIVSSFLDALNQGDLDTVLGHFGQGFQWYSAPAGRTAERTVDSIYQTEDLALYFQTRIDNKEQMKPQKMHITGRDHLGGIDFAINLHRTADDLQWGKGDVGGKGAVDCEKGTIMVWSLGEVAPLQ